MTKGTELEGLEDVLVKAEEEYGINAIVLLAIIVNESAWGTSNRAKSQNNLTGYSVYDPMSRGENFNSRDQCVLETAKLLKEDYLSPEGKHYNGVSIWAINENYCKLGDQKTTDPNWSKNVISISNTLVNKANK